LSMREITAYDHDDLLEIRGDPETMRIFPCTVDHHWVEELAEDPTSAEDATMGEDALSTEDASF
jgi:hypothetical protein